MKVELDKKALQTLVKGIEPIYDIVGNPLGMKAGLHINAYDKAIWSNLDDLSEEELYSLYKLCRESIEFYNKLEDDSKNFKLLKLIPTNYK